MGSKVWRHSRPGPGAPGVERRRSARRRHYVAAATPIAIAQPPSEIDALAAGTGHSLAQGADNTAWSWGLNLFGQTRDGSTARSLVPVPIGELDGTWGVIPPAFSPGEGTYSPPLSVTISTLTSGAAIHYTTDGTEPTASAPVIASGGSIQLNTSTVLAARAFKSGLSPSRVTSAIYSIVLGALATPVAQPPAGTYSSAQSVTLTADQGATIRFTIDGSDPTESSAAYANPISISAATIKARAFKIDYTPSPILTASYVIQVENGLPPDPSNGRDPHRSDRGDELRGRNRVPVLGAESDSA